MLRIWIKYSFFDYGTVSLTPLDFYSDFSLTPAKQLELMPKEVSDSEFHTHET